MSTLMALTRDVSPAIARCELTHCERVPIDYSRAVAQHRDYEACLARLGCSIRRLPPLPGMPDSVFVADPCFVLPELAVIARPGAESRRGETESVAEALKEFRPVHFITSPGTLDGGDVIGLGNTVFVGESRRTNLAGREQLRSILANFGYTLRSIPLRDCLHLQSAVTPVGERHVLLNPAWIDSRHFDGWTVIEIDPREPFAANVLLVQESVIVSCEHARTRDRLESRGLRTETVDLSELAKAEGGLTCCSVIFEV